jgi:SAM-dependent methyltransferase
MGNEFMAFTLHSTAGYHRERMLTLGWELTVCNALEQPDSPCRSILKKPDSYGRLLYAHLERFFPMGGLRGILEIGGGYGFLMRDFLSRKKFAPVVLVDISPAMIERQRSTLSSAGNDRIEYRCEDFLATPASRLAGIDLAILNENLGDFPQLLDLDPGFLDAEPGSLEGPLRLARRFCSRYGLSPPPRVPFHINIGAWEALEKLCRAGIPRIFIGEHSCEATVPFELAGSLSLPSSGNPERIPLYGHEEYTIRFSDLERIAGSLGYRVCRGPFADFLEWEKTGRLRRILSSPQNLGEEDEAIRQFIEDLYCYEYLILVRERLQ